MNSPSLKLSSLLCPASYCIPSLETALSMFRTNATTIKGRKTSCTPLFITETLVIYKLLLNSVQKITKKSRIMDRMFELLQEDTHFQQNSWESKSSRLKKKCIFRCSLIIQMTTNDNYYCN